MEKRGAAVERAAFARHLLAMRCRWMHRSRACGATLPAVASSPDPAGAARRIGSTTIPLAYILQPCATAADACGRRRQPGCGAVWLRHAPRRTVLFVPPHETLPAIMSVAGPG